MNYTNLIKQYAVAGLVALCLSATLNAKAGAQGASPIELASVTKMERAVKQADGSTVRKLVDIKSAVPGDEVVFINSFRNGGQLAAGNLSLVNPVPENTVLKAAFGERAQITYSLDGGKTYDLIDKLVVKSADGKTRPARLEDSTHVRWVLAGALPPGQTGEVGFKVQVK